MLTVIAPEPGYLGSMLAQRLGGARPGSVFAGYFATEFPAPLGVRFAKPDRGFRELCRLVEAADELVIMLTWGDALNHLSVEDARPVADAISSWSAGPLVIVASTESYGLAQTSINSMTPAMPDDDRGKTAMAVEDLLRTAALSRGQRVTTLRLPHVYGPGSMLFEYVDAGTVPWCGDPDTVFSHIHVEDAVRAILTAVRSGPASEVALSDFDPIPWGLAFESIRQWRPQVEFPSTSWNAAVRALKLLALDDSVIPSGVVPGTGLGWRRDLSIDPARGWAALHDQPNHPSFQMGTASIFAPDSVDSVA